MRKITSLAILALMWLVGSAAFADDHEYVNGICQLHTRCFQMPEMDPADGFYMLRNAGNVEWISDQVATGQLYLDCKLMNDIDFENIENLHNPIGPDNGKKYNATFDGQGFRIKNLIINRPDKERQGFFGSLRGNPNLLGQGTVIKNLIIDKSCSITGGKRTGGIVGSGQNNEKEIIIMNCVNEGTISTPSNNGAGIVGGSESNHPIWKITNCINAGTIISTDTGHEAAGIAAWLGDNGNTRVTNCINIGDIQGMDGAGHGIARMSDYGRVVNSFDFSGNEAAKQGLPSDRGLELEDLTSGKLAYYMNQLAGSTVWYQTLSEDAYPVPIAISKQVYLQGLLNCDGTPLEGGSYTNELVEPVIPPHEWAEGDYHCVNCGTASDDFCKIVDGFYQLNSALDVCWFADFVNKGNTEVNAKLNCDVDFTDYPEFAGIGTRDNGFKGIFDGGFHTISNMDMSWRGNEEWVGFINFLNGGATVKNLRGDETCIINARGNAGFIGGSTAPGDIILENLAFEGDVSCSRAGAGGIIGCNTGSQAHILMTNCYSTGFISGSEVMENGALSAWLGSSGAVITNCWSSATVSGVQNDDKYLARFDNAVFNNCYSLNGTPLQCSLIEYEDLESGAFCFKLNGNQENIVWYQTIGEDMFPTFMPGHKQVYANVEMKCDGSFIAEDATYSNDEGSSIRPDHQFVDGFCSVCHHQDPSFPFIEGMIPNPDHDIETLATYTTHNSNDGSKLAINNSVAEHWNMQWFETYQTIKGLEPGIYRLRLQGLQRVQSWNDGQDGNKEGDAYEFGVLSEEYLPLYHSSQYFAEVNGKKVAARFKDIAEDAQEVRVNEIEAYNEISSKYAPNSLAACRRYFGKGLYWNEPIYFAIENAADSVNIGVENSTYLYGNWTVWDSWRLDKVADGTPELIRKQMAAAIQEDLELLEAQDSLVQAYADAKDLIESASSLEDIMKASDVLARTPNLIRNSHLAYIDYISAIDAIKAERDQRHDLNGPATDLLDKYLTEIDEPSEELPNGTYLGIINDKPLSVEQLKAEIAFAKNLYANAVMSSLQEGSDASNVIKNAGFTADNNFKDWVKTQTKAGADGSNFNCNTGFTDIYPVAGSWNTAFDLHQDIDVSMPNGIYELEAPAFYRPGGNTEGFLEDYVPAELYINNWYTPIMNIYAGAIPYGEEVNGVNGRFDPNDPEIPHAGETTDSYEYATDYGYVPEKRQACSFAFAAPGRYVNKVYGIVTDGKLTVGIRNTGKPWYENGMAMWGQFKLTYMGQSETAIAAMIEKFGKRLEALDYGRYNNEMYISESHIENLEALMATAQAAQTLEEKLAAVKALNDEFNDVQNSYDAYYDLYQTMEFCNSKYIQLADTDPDLALAFSDKAEEIQDHIYAGDLTDEEARNYREGILNDTSLGGGFYVQGDLIDAEGNALSYSGNSLYLMTKNEDGTYTATVKVQDRSAKAKAEARAGIYISRMDEIYKLDQDSCNFITPEGHNSFVMHKGTGSDMQMAGGEVKVTFNPATGEVNTEVIDYKWYANVYVVGSIINDRGEQHRWKNDEMAALAHKGIGVYEGIVTFYQDPNDSNQANFTIMACRSNVGAIEHSLVARDNWTEARYGSAEARWPLANGVAATDLLRGRDRSWWLDWGTCTDETQQYKITFDLNHNTITATSMLAPIGDVNGDGAVTIKDVVAVLEIMAADGADTAADVNGDGAVTIKDVVAVLEEMAKK